MYGTTKLGGGLRFGSYSASGTTIGAVGGTIVEFVAGADLLIGDAVYLTSTDSLGGEVNKSTTSANYQTAAGIVVGGDATYMQVGTSSSDVGVAAAASGQRVLVQVNGKAWGVADGTVAVGALVGAGTSTAGRLEDTTVATAGQIIGISLGAGTTGAAMQVLINHM